MKTFITFLGFLMVFSLCLDEGEARGKKKKRRAKKAKKVEQATEETRTAITKLMGKFKWGMTSSNVLGRLSKKVEEEFLPKIQGERDPLLQDRLRREMMAKMKEVKKNYAKFEGQQTPWDVSLVDKEFGHKNNETMAVMWTKKDRRFYFFHHDRLWKLYIAFNADLFKGKTFDDFAGVMEARFGKADRKYVTTLKGESKLDHLAWPNAGGSRMKAIDHTGFYGNFCLVLEDVAEWENVDTGRRLNSPKRDTGDSLVEAVTSGRGNETNDENEDIVDQITGRRESGDAVKSITSPGTRKRSIAPGSASPNTVAPKPKRKKKINAKNPLEGMDI